MVRRETPDVLTRMNRKTSGDLDRRVSRGHRLTYKDCVNHLIYKICGDANAAKVERASVATARQTMMLE